jgi:hypothetical protein
VWGDREVGSLLFSRVRQIVQELCEKGGYVRATLLVGKNTLSWVPVVHTCNPSYSGGRSGGSCFKASPGK